MITFYAATVLAAAVLGVLVDWLLKTRLPNNPRTVHVVSGIVAIIVLVGVIVWYSAYVQETKFTIRVANSGGASVENAKVILLIPGQPQAQLTDTNGTTTFSIVPTKLTVKLVVETKEYPIYEQDFDLSAVNFLNIRLEDKTSKNSSLIFRVIDSKTEDPISGAEVLLLFQGQVVDDIADNNGIAKFLLPIPDKGIDAQISVGTKDYKIKYQTISLFPDRIQDVRLDPRSQSLSVGDVLDSIPTTVSVSSTITAPTRVSPTESVEITNQIAFYVGDEDVSSQIYIMNADGSNVRQLTNTKGVNVARSWSSDNRKIYFASTRTGNWQIYVMNSDGSNVQQLTVGSAANYDPIISPDDHFIAFTSSRDGDRNVYVMDVDGNNVRQVTNDPNMERMFDWSPDGKHILFSRYTNGNMEIYVMKSDGSDQKNLTNSPDIESAAKWSPDGKKILFSSNRTRDFEVYTMNIDGTDQQNITNNSSQDYL